MNAVTDRGRVLQVRSEAMPSGVRIAVADSGTGIDPKSGAVFSTLSSPPNLAERDGAFDLPINCRSPWWAIVNVTLSSARIDLCNRPACSQFGDRSTRNRGNTSAGVGARWCRDDLSANRQLSYLKGSGVSQYWKLGMSALGQKRTFAAQNIMSALPPKADICSLPLGTVNRNQAKDRSICPTTSAFYFPSACGLHGRAL